MKTFSVLSFSRIIRNSRERGEETTSESGLRFILTLSLIANGQLFDREDLIF